MNVVVCTDANYIMPCGIMLKSLCMNNKDESISFFFVVNETVNQTLKKQLTEIIGEYPNKRIYFFLIDDERLEGLPIPIKRYTKSVYYRLFLAEILPADIHKVLFMDGDIIVRHSLKPLWDTNISKVAVGVVPDMGDANMSFYNRLQYDSRKGYFNGGVLLINLDYWRNHDVLNRLLKYLKEYPERILLNDQDAMNVVLQDEKRNLHLKYNMQEGFLYKNNDNFEWNKYGEELTEALTNPSIIHYTHEIKPWFKECPHPYKGEFLKYKDMTVWKDVSLSKYCKERPLGILRRIINSLCRRKNIPLYNPTYLDTNLLSRHFS